MRYRLSENQGDWSQAILCFATREAGVGIPVTHILKVRGRRIPRKSASEESPLKWNFGILL